MSGAVTDLGRPVVTAHFEDTTCGCFKRCWQAGVTDGVEIWKEGVIIPGFATKSFFTLNLSAPLCVIFFKTAITPSAQLLRELRGKSTNGVAH